MVVGGGLVYLHGGWQMFGVYNWGLAEILVVYLVHSSLSHEWPCCSVT